MKEKEINIPDMMLYILLHWRGIIAAMFIGGILLSCYSYFVVSKNINEKNEHTKIETLKLTEVIRKHLAEDDPNIETAVGELLHRENGESLNDALKKGLEKELTEKQLSNIEITLYYEGLYLDKKEYQQQSILMQIDPDNVQNAEMTIMISSDNLEKSYNLTKVYEDIAFSAVLLEKMAEFASVSTSYIEEIYFLDRTSAARQYGTDTFKVSIVHYDKKICEKLLEIVVNYIATEQQSLSQLWGEHEVVFFNNSLSSVSNREVLSLQQNTQEYILNLKSHIFTLKNAFSDEEWYYYNLLTLDKVAGNPYENMDAASTKEPDIAVEQTSMPNIRLNHVIIGIVLGALGYMFVLFMGFAMNTKIRATDRFDYLYNIVHLGNIPNVTEEKKRFGFLDNAIWTLFNKNRKKLTRIQAVSLVATALKMTVGREALREVHLVGCVPNEVTTHIYQQISDILSKDNVTVHFLVNILYDAVAMEKLNNIKAVFLVEKAGLTSYEEIAREIEFLKRQGINIWGGVIIE